MLARGRGLFPQKMFRQFGLFDLLDPNGGIVETDQQRPSERHRITEGLALAVDGLYIR